MTCLVLRQQEQSELFERFRRSTAAGHSCAVVDPAWPEPVQRVAIDRIEAAVRESRVGDGDLVVFSSGSTGDPRGIVRTVESWRASLGPLTEITGIRAGDRVWLGPPLSSSLALYGAFHADAVGARVRFSTDSPDDATAVHCVPSQLAGLLDRAAAGGLASLRLAVVAGDRLPDDLRRRGEAAGWRVIEYYGAAELSFVAWRDDAGPLRAFPGVETRVLDGVLSVRSPYLARGYLTTGEDGPLHRDADGWATLGDLARMVGGGLEILGRGDTAVTTGGHTIVVDEVERVLRGLDGVHDVAVLGLPHPRFGQVLAALVVGPVDDAALRSGVAALPPPSRPRRWLHVSTLPRTSGGKLRRHQLAALAESPIRS